MPVAIPVAIHNHTAARTSSSCAPQGPQQPMKLLTWKRPFFRHTAVNCDGSFRASDGTCGYGIVLRDFFGRLIMGKAGHFHKSELNEMMIGSSKYGITVLMVEMVAIRDGLRLARALGLEYVEIQSDSKSAISIISGGSNCPRECLALLSDIRSEVNYFKGVAFMFIYRERNRAADFLSKFLTRDGQRCFDSSEMPTAFQRIVTEDALGFATARFLLPLVSYDEYLD